ncbi:MAG: hypothetical protein AAFX94_21865, partial [Myxococcota bacterium]
MWLLGVLSVLANAAPLEDPEQAAQAPVALEGEGGESPERITVQGVQRERETVQATVELWQRRNRAADPYGAIAGPAIGLRA